MSASDVANIVTAIAAVLGVAGSAIAWYIKVINLLKPNIKVTHGVLTGTMLCGGEQFEDALQFEVVFSPTPHPYRIQSMSINCPTYEAKSLGDWIQVIDKHQEFNFSPLWVYDEPVIFCFCCPVSKLPSLLSISCKCKSTNRFFRMSVKKDIPTSAIMQN